ncbi:unnamed protein product [Vitrella brassicaformis CCMP3155]|uniref:AP2/ERF domain-containing protein n=2 Tax=Vitrella brassicaformis TaxID=1169539 RepID=A0A0G4ECQ0_VITBC|nr:unnamed protein product [Vitrella brassicaformis CCMP3155]|eukprot:CEL93516.1 unnamed protein product [Vitrella brassicaformis CCMP3155]
MISSQQSRRLLHSLSSLSCPSSSPAISLAPSSRLAPDATTATVSSFQQLRFTKHPYKPKTREVVHPHIPHPEFLPLPNCYRAVTDPNQSFYPLGYRAEKHIESLRTGEYLGEDYPYNLLQWRYWRRRKYNVTQQTHPWFTSEVKCVDYLRPFAVFTTSWIENGRHRVRRFRTAYGVLRARRAAEKFRIDMMALGRVDNRATERQRRLKYLEGRAERLRRKYIFHKVAAGQF